MSAARVEVRNATKRFPGPVGVTALDDVDLEIEPGTAVSVVGANGAGKSTLLGVIAGVVAPERGTVIRSGRCASILELGAGFHADLTGRENVELALAIMGIGPRRLPALRRSAEEFAGIGDGVHLARRHLSDGMVARLACAAAVVTDPDVLLLDEVLGVGDAVFQRSMLGRVAELVAGGGILVLVSHNVRLAAAASSRSVWLDQGRIRRDGVATEVLGEYEASSFGWAARAGSDEVTIHDIACDPDRIAPGDPLVLHIEFTCDRQVVGALARVEVRPSVGDDTLWMRSLGESSETRRMNLVAATPPLALPTLHPGEHVLEVQLDRMPITSTAAEISVVIADGQRRVLDEMSLDLDIGEQARRPHFLLEARLGPSLH